LKLLIPAREALLPAPEFFIVIASEAKQSQNTDDFKGFSHQKSTAYLESFAN
jgi:hypothetical protein